MSMFLRCRGKEKKKRMLFGEQHSASRVCAPPLVSPETSQRVSGYTLCCLWIIDGRVLFCFVLDGYLSFASSHLICDVMSQSCNYRWVCR